VTPALGAMGLSLAGVAAYQYIFVDRERRQLAGALGQYTSKEIARQVAENPELCRRAEMREVTAMFTDLQGFTSISERIGAERTQRVLNICLGEFTEVMLRHEAMVNKFIGDGIFAFWNPVIYPQTDHALLACETAVDLMEALRRLADRGGEPVLQQLVLRVGVATGNAIVGPCGSEQKFDYTCIGDSVNVAARLESANKFYGTRILISGPTRHAVGERFSFRALGGVQVKGKTQAVPVYELLGRMGQVAEETLAYARRFDDAVREFQNRSFGEAGVVFAALASERPDDRAARIYAETAERFVAEPPAEEWNGAIELTEK
jgi:adenylate cyclase